jgi:hypothetical protein
MRSWSAMLPSESLRVQGAARGTSRRSVPWPSRSGAAPSSSPAVLTSCSRSKAWLYSIDLDRLISTQG